MCGREGGEEHAQEQERSRRRCRSMGREPSDDQSCAKKPSCGLHRGLTAVRAAWGWWQLTNEQRKAAGVLKYNGPQWDAELPGAAAGEDDEDEDPDGLESPQVRDREALPVLVVLLSSGRRLMPLLAVLPPGREALSFLVLLLSFGQRLMPLIVVLLREGESHCLSSRSRCRSARRLRSDAFACGAAVRGLRSRELAPDERAGCCPGEARLPARPARAAPRTLHTPFSHTQHTPTQQQRTHGTQPLPAGLSSPAGCRPTRF